MTPQNSASFHSKFFKPESVAQTHYRTYARDCVFQGSILGEDKNDSDMFVLVVMTREKYGFERDITRLISDAYLAGKGVEKSVTMTDAEQPDSTHVYNVIALRSENSSMLQKMQNEIGNFQAIAKVAELIR